MAEPHRPGQLRPFSRLPEPALLFSSTDANAVDTHPLRGLIAHGPYSQAVLAEHSGEVRIAIVGPETGRDGRRTLLGNLNKAHQPTDRKEYVPPYPGFQELYGPRLRGAAAAALLEWPSSLDDLGSGEPHERVRRAISERLRQLAGVRDLFDVAVVHLPDSWGPGLRAEGFDAHDEVKAVGAELGIPTQIINDRTFSFHHLASMAWRLSIALYVKAGGTPWRLAPLAGMPADSAFIGLAYALRGDSSRSQFVTCCSQVFDSDGGGMQFVAYDARDRIEDSDEARRNPYLSRADMRAVMARSLRLYQSRNGGRVPRRLTVHKTTAFTEDEIAGATDALSAVDEIECIEITTNVAWRGVWLRAPKNGTKGVPDGYPVHRGTMVPLSGTTSLLWVAGNAPSVARRGDSFFQGGKSIPTPVIVTRHAGRGSLESVALEALALTKMDWNNDALYDPLPVTVAYSQRLARVIAHVPTLERREYPYRMFM